MKRELKDNYLWDHRKYLSNLHKHGVAFEEAVEVLEDCLSKTRPDPTHSEEEARFVTVGYANSGKLLVVIHVEREGRTRIVSARHASRSERRNYAIQEN